ncbi:MAG: AAA family ATPase [Microgenomates group bacterium]|jgi:MoxR-like ATPase
MAKIEVDYLSDTALLTPLTGYQGLLETGKNKTSLDTFEAVDSLKGAMKNVSQRVVGRDKLVSQTLLALLTKEHQLIFARPGTAKSLYGKTVFGQFENAQTFSIQLSQGTTEEKLIGAYDLAMFNDGILWNKTEGSIITANFAFLDEFMDANDMVLRTLLGILNEREFINGQQHEKAKLHTAIATTNYLRVTDASEAVLDRMLFKARLNPEVDIFDQVLIDRVYSKHNGHVVAPDQYIPMEVLAELSGIVNGDNPNRLITASNAVLFLKNQLIRNFVEGVYEQRKQKDSKANRPYISPRTIAKSRNTLNASALLHGRFEVTGQDLSTLRYLLTTVQNDGGATTQNDEDESFLKALDDTLGAFSGKDLEDIEHLFKINDFYEAYRENRQIEAKKRDNIFKKPFTLLSEILGVTSWVEVNQNTFSNTLTAMNISNPEVQKVRESILHRIN